MSFDHPTPDPKDRYPGEQQPRDEQPRDEQPRYLDAEFVDFNAAIEQQEPPRIPYTKKGFRDIYEEAKWLRKLSGNTSIAFMLIFMALLGAGAYADSVEFRRMNKEVFAEMADSMAKYSEADDEIDPQTDSLFRAMAISAAEDARNTPTPGFLERFGLRILSALGSIGFFVFASAAVSEISFRAYEGREMEPYEVLDTLTKSHGMNLLKLGGIFLGLLLLVVLITMSVHTAASGSMALLVLVIVFVQLYFQLRLGFSVQAVIGEDLGPVDALKRSWKLTKGNLLRLIWWAIIFFILFMIVAFFFYFLPIFIVSMIIAMIFSWAAEVVFIFVGLVAIALMVKHFSLIFFFQMALYRELRLRLDGIDPMPPSTPVIGTPFPQAT